ncbi:PREDICTED: uncharacterized protein LOC109179317 [Ipomoea nil]|uniref:uncharacterized protein LOC109179317 n=1 Tax=Ipomoea nil TaxID=35883 RepID=UPI000901946F|nr:PREDICTED: uncharacterized protein LOC109179317 [Ipomoea nil]
MFLWRAISDILPTTTNLLIKRVDVDPRCAMCGLSQEDTMHALVLCDFARNIWDKSNLTIPNIITNIFYVWFDELLNVLDFYGIFYAVAILYNIWRARNKAVWEATLPRPEVVLKIAAAAKLAWTRAHPQQPTVPPTTLTTTPNPFQGNANPHAPEPSAAEPPGPPRRICRVDGGYLQETGQAALGVLLLDTDGGYVSAFSGPLQGCSSPLMAEVLACKEALSWLKDRGEQNVQVYTDCLTLHRYLTTPTIVLRTYLGYAIDTCRLIASSFQSFIRREFPENLVIMYNDNNDNDDALPSAEENIMPADLGRTDAAGMTASPAYYSGRFSGVSIVGNLA